MIRATFKLLAQRYHPDRWRQEQEYANRRMAEINEAYQQLSKYNAFRPVVPSDFYQVLGVSKQADPQLIHVAYEALAKKYNKAPARLMLIEQAYATLSQPRQRKLYDLQLDRPHFHPSPGLRLGRVYLIYHLTFYLFIAVIGILAHIF